MTDVQKAFAKSTLLACKGFTETFVDKLAPLRFKSVLDNSFKVALPEVEGNNDNILNYGNLSVYYNAERRVPFVSAYNIDGNKKAIGVKRANKFRADPRIDASVQLSQTGFYDLIKIKNKTEFEIGHMAANNEMAWGENAQIQSYQTFHFTNSVPQAEKLNTGIWKTLESYIIKEAAAGKSNKRISVFTGPVLNDRDPAYIADPSFQIPLLFYKVIVFGTSKGIFSTAFIMSHEEKMKSDHLFAPSQDLSLASDDPIFRDFKYKKVFQVGIPFIEEVTGLNFSWKRIKKVAIPEQKNQIKTISKIKDAAQAEKVEKQLRKGEIPSLALANEAISETEISKDEFRLNIILPQ